MSNKGKNSGYSTSISSIGILERYIHFIDAVQNLKPATRVRIQEYLKDKGDLISESTFHRIRRSLQEGMGIVLHHDKRLGYSIKKESQEELERFMDLTGLSLKEGHVKQALLSEPKLFDYVLLEKQLIGNSFQTLNPIIKALLKQKKLSIQYRKYHPNELKKYTNLEPHYIKKYMGRWYLFSYAPWLNRPMTLAIDNRMEVVEVSTEPFQRKEHLFQKVFEVVGLNYSQAAFDFDIEEAIDIEFEIISGYASYLDSLPLHASQFCLGESPTEGKLLYRIRVIPNYELVQAFLQMGDQAKILSPSFFVDYFKGCVKDILNRYSN